MCLLCIEFAWIKIIRCSSRREQWKKIWFWSNLKGRTGKINTVGIIGWFLYTYFLILESFCCWAKTLYRPLQTRCCHQYFKTKTKFKFKEVYLHPFIYETFCLFIYLFIRHSLHCLFVFNIHCIYLVGYLFIWHSLYLFVF